MAVPTEPTSTEQFIYEQVQRRYDFEFERANDLDNKASNLVGWTGLIISIILAGGGLLFTRAGEGKYQLSQTDIQLLTVALVLLVVSLGVGLIAFRVIHFDVVPVPRPFTRTYANRTHRETLRRLTATMIVAVENNEIRNNRKAQLVTFTWILFLVGIAFAVTFIMAQYSKLIV